MYSRGEFMKKILIVIFLFPIIVKAETFYSDYKLTKSLDNLDKDLYKIETIKKYNTFNYIKKDLGYLEENNNYIKDEKDYIEKTIESSNYDENKEQNIIIHPYVNNKTNSIYISFKYQHFYLKIYEVEVYVNDKKTLTGCFIYGKRKQNPWQGYEKENTNFQIDN